MSEKHPRAAPEGEDQFPKLPPPQRGNDGETTSSRVHSLNSYCCKAIFYNIDSITSLDNVPYRLVKPALEMCSAEALLRIEKFSPHLRQDCQELWKAICLKEFPEVRRQDDEGTLTEPRSWRAHYYSLKEQEKKRLEETASRIRSARIELEKEKKGRQIRITTALPPKRRKLGTDPRRAQTLLDKARIETNNITKTMFPKGSSAYRSKNPISAGFASRPGTTSSSRETSVSAASSTSTFSSSSSSSAGRTQAPVPITPTGLQTPPSASPTKRKDPATTMFINRRVSAPQPKALSRSEKLPS